MDCWGDDLGRVSVGSPVDVFGEDGGRGIVGWVSLSIGCKRFPVVRASGSYVISVGNGWGLMGGRGLIWVTGGLGGSVNGFGDKLIGEVVVRFVCVIGIGGSGGDGMRVP